jgi:prepilin-type N-terminal cleavage/methylation domain-containing protein
MTPRRTNGFTLLELLVAVTITLVLAGIMVTVTTQTLAVWRRTQDGFSASVQAKVVLDLIERDFQGAHFAHDGHGITWLAADIITAPGDLVNHGWQISAMMKPSDAISFAPIPESPAGIDAAITHARFGLSGVWLRFITSNVESSGSLPVAVSYHIARRPVNGTNVTASNPADVRYSLFRSAVSVENTFAAGYDVTASAYQSTQSSAPVQRAPAVLSNPHTVADALATNVIDFGVWFYVRTANGSLKRIFPETNTDTSHRTSDSVAASDGSRFPEVIDVMVRILTEEGARQIDHLERGLGGAIRPPEFASDDQWWWGIVDAHSKVFVRRVEVRRGMP